MTHYKICWYAADMVTEVSESFLLYIDGEAKSGFSLSELR